LLRKVGEEVSISYMNYASPNVQYTYDLSNNPFFKKDSKNAPVPSTQQFQGSGYYQREQGHWPYAYYRQPFIGNGGADF